MGDELETELADQILRLTARLAVTEDRQEQLAGSTDQFFLVVIAIIIFFMQGGFAFLEAGSVRSKNTVNILIKNLLDVFIGAASYWAIGWGLAYGKDGNLFCGGSEFFNYKLEYSEYPRWFFQFVFAATAATIVSGAIAERCQFGAYCLYSIVITAWIYPPVSHWAWSGEGWLSFAGCSYGGWTFEDGGVLTNVTGYYSPTTGEDGRYGPLGAECPGYYKDFAGSGVVHLLGAGCSLVGCCFIGARRGRFSQQGDPIDMPGHSVPLAGLGGFILFFGFLAFNGGSQTTISSPGDGGVVALAIVNTVLGASTGGLSVLILAKCVYHGKWSFLMTLNGALAGMVALCAGCNTYEPWAALVVGAGAGLSFLAVHTLMLKLRLDDPLDAVAVHGGGGLWGLIAVPFFMSAGLADGERGIFFDGHLGRPWAVLGIQLAAAAAILAWSVGWSSLLFGGLQWANWLRVPADIEAEGMDLLKHGESAYPGEASVEHQSNQKNAENNNGEDAIQMMPSIQGQSGVDDNPGLEKGDESVWCGVNPDLEE